MYNDKKISVVLPAYNEEENIKKAIEDFFGIRAVDEVIVVDNNSTDNTYSIASQSRAKVIKEYKQGYGWAMRRGMYEATGDYIFTAEPDGTFRALDIFKFLVYADEFDVIFGTRTAKNLIWEGAKMTPFLRYGNVFVAKLLEYVHNGPCLTDVGCSFKFIKREAYNKIRTKLKVGGNHFSPEFMIVCLQNLKCIEIPVNYLERVGTSTITDTNWKGFKLGLRMIWLIIKRYFG